MTLSDFDYALPEELIAQRPADRRDMSRLMILRGSESEHREFRDLPEYLNAGDCLILNDSRVIAARLFAGKTEFLLLRDTGGGVWECLVKPGKKCKIGAEFRIGGCGLTVTDILEGGVRLIKFSQNPLGLGGEMPLPPYIHEKLSDPERYQTVYANAPGSAAAPTAGLHFTPELLQKIRDKGVNIGFVTLHVGLGTFRPVKCENIDEHVMHREYYSIPPETARLIAETKRAGGRVIAVGTTAARAIESGADHNSTDIFIKPGYKFKAVDALITNFHLPKSTLLMLVSALAGRERILSAYREAIHEKYRFFSFGDAMFITGYPL